jgi:general secretion pathway protein L
MLAERLNRYTYKLPLINLLNKVLPEETTIRQLTVSGNMVEMRGTVPKASELLGSLSQGHGVKNARFISPLKEDKKTGMEIFRLTFIFDPQITQIK